MLLAAGPAAAQTTTRDAPTNESELLIPDPAATGGTAATGVQAASVPGVSTWDFVRMFLVLALVVAVIYGVFWLLRRTSRRTVQENELIRVLGSRSLSGGRALHLVEVASSVFLVGSADGGVDLIAEITDKESLDAVRLQAAEAGAVGRVRFADTLARIFKPTKKAPGLGEGVDFIRGQRERLRRLRGGR